MKGRCERCQGRGAKGVKGRGREGATCSRKREHGTRQFRSVGALGNSVADLLRHPLGQADERFHQRRQRRLQLARGMTIKSIPSGSWGRVGGTPRAAGVSSGCGPPRRRAAGRPKGPAAGAAGRWDGRTPRSTRPPRSRGGGRPAGNRAARRMRYCGRNRSGRPFVRHMSPTQVAARVLGVMLVDLADRLAVGVAELLGQDDLDFGQQVAGRAVLRRHAVAFHAELRAAGGAGRNAQASRCRAAWARRPWRPPTASPSVTGTRTAGDCRGVGSTGAAATWMVSRMSPGVPPRGAGWPWPRMRIFLPSSMPGGNLHRQRLGLARGALHGDLHLAAGDRPWRRGSAVRGAGRRRGGACPAGLRNLPAARRNWPKRSPNPPGASCPKRSPRNWLRSMSSAVKPPGPAPARCPGDQVQV